MYHAGHVSGINIAIFVKTWKVMFKSNFNILCNFILYNLFPILRLNAQVH